MTRGKQTCKILKEIRRQIAEANDIEFITSECRYKGDCLGTCPKCEAEVRYLEQQLRSRQRMGKAVSLAGISAGMIFMSGCSGTTSNQSNTTPQGEPVASVEQRNAPDTIVEGETPAIEDTIPTGVEEDVVITSQERLLYVGEVGKTGGIEASENNKEASEAIGEPTFPGGESELMEWVSQHIVYPQGCWESHIEGRVVIRFMIKADGSVGDAEIIRGVCPELDDEALRVVKTLPKFNPAIQDGQAVDYWFTLPILFKLPEDQPQETH